jgi:hypothetical protein
MCMFNTCIIYNFYVNSILVYNISSKDISVMYFWNMFNTCVIYYFHVDSILVTNISNKGLGNMLLEYVQYMCNLLFPSGFNFSLQHIM